MARRFFPAIAVLGDTSGTAAIEFGLCIPLFAVFLLGVVELGFGTYQAMQVQNSVEAGALYVAKYGWNQAGIQNAVTGATGTTGVTATPAPTQFCGCPTTTGVTPVACTGVTCTDGKPPGSYVKINASIPHARIITYPGLAMPTSFSASTIVRVN